MDLGGDPDTAARLVDQLGVISRTQLVTLGWRRDQIDGAVQSSRLEVVHRGVYRVPGGGRPSGQAAMAAVLRIGVGARITGEGVLSRLHVQGVPPGMVGTVLVAPPRRPRIVPLDWRRDGAPDHDHATLGSIPATTPDRALVEVARMWPSRRWLAVFDACRWRRLASTAGVLRVAGRLGGRHLGVQHLRRLVDAGQLQQESHGERDLAAALLAIGFADADVRWQEQVSPRHRVDVLLPAHRVVIEYDGRDVHNDPRDQRKDRARDLELAALGYHVVRLRAEDLRDHRRLRARLDHEIAAANR